MTLLQRSESYRSCIHHFVHLETRDRLLFHHTVSDTCILLSIIFKRRWSPKYVSELYLYGESNGIIWDIVVNKTSQPFNKLFVVGAFDTVSETSQIQFCSVGEWDGLSFDKVRTRSQLFILSLFRHHPQDHRQNHFLCIRVIQHKIQLS